MNKDRITAKCAAAFLAAFLLLPCAVSAQAASTVQGIRNEGESSGLSITPQAPDVDISNLNPGDRKTASLELKNSGTHTLSVYIKTQIDSEFSPTGGNLADKMELTIWDGSSYYSQGETFRGVAQSGSELIGTMQPGSVKTLNFSTNLPGDTTDNGYQGASMQVEWIFTAVYSDAPGSTPGGGGGGGGGGGNRYGGGDTPVGGTVISAPSSQPSSAPPASETPEPTSAVTNPLPNQPAVSPATGERFMTPIRIFCASVGVFLAGGICLITFRKIRRI